MRSRGLGGDTAGPVGDAAIRRGSVAARPLPFRGTVAVSSRVSGAGARAGTGAAYRSRRARGQPQFADRAAADLRNVAEAVGVPCQTGAVRRCARLVPAPHRAGTGSAWGSGSAGPAHGDAAASGRRRGGCLSRRHPWFGRRVGGTAGRGLARTRQRGGGAAGGGARNLAPARVPTALASVVDVLVGEPFTLDVAAGRAGLEQATERIRATLAALVHAVDSARDSRAARHGDR